MLPPALSWAIETALGELGQDPDCDLQPGRRASVREVLDGISYSGIRSRQSRSLYLEILSLERVLPVWGTIRLGASLPLDLISKAKLLLAGRGDAIKTHHMLAETYWPRFQNIPYDDNVPIDLEQCVCYGSIRLLEEAVISQKHPAWKISKESIDMLVKNDELSPFQEWDVSYAASVVYAGGAPWEPRSNIGQRRIFWTWWLTEGVSQAYLAFPGPA